MAEDVGREDAVTAANLMRTSVTGSQHFADRDGRLEQVYLGEVVAQRGAAW